jgi:hypothetical protein
MAGRFHKMTMCHRIVAKRLLAVAMALAFLIPSSVRADVTGTIAILQVNGIGPVRFTLKGAPALCTSVSVGTTSWGDVTVGQSSVTSDGAKAILALLTSAKLSGAQIRIYANNGNSGTYGCSVSAVELQ